MKKGCVADKLEVLHITQSTLSRQQTQLEDEENISDKRGASPSQKDGGDYGEKVLYIVANLINIHVRQKINYYF